MTAANGDYVHVTQGERCPARGGWSMYRCEVVGPHAMHDLDGGFAGRTRWPVLSPRPYGHLADDLLATQRRAADALLDQAKEALAAAEQKANAMRAEWFERGCPDAGPGRSGCGDIVADGHDNFDPSCPACVEMTSDAPEWTI